MLRLRNHKFKKDVKLNVQITEAGTTFMTHLIRAPLVLVFCGTLSWKVKALFSRIKFKTINYYLVSVESKSFIMTNLLKSSLNS